MAAVRRRENPPAPTIGSGAVIVARCRSRPAASPDRPPKCWIPRHEDPFRRARAAARLPTAPVAAQKAGDPLAGTSALAGLLPIAVDRDGGRVLVILPAPDAEGVSGRFLYTASLRTGIGAPETGLDHAQQGDTYVLAFRRIGRKVIAEYENPRFRATGGTAADGGGAAELRHHHDLGRRGRGDAARWRHRRRSVGLPHPRRARRGGCGRAGRANTSSTRPPAWPIRRRRRSSPTMSSWRRGTRTWTSEKPGAAIANIAPDPRMISLTVHHSLIRLPGPGVRADPLRSALGRGVSAHRWSITPRHWGRTWSMRSPRASGWRSPIPPRRDGGEEADRLLHRSRRARADPHRAGRGGGLVADGVRQGGLCRCLSGRDPARRSRSARRALQCRQLGQSRHPRLVLPGQVVTDTADGGCVKGSVLLARCGCSRTC
ncbi:hypothetical protein AB5I41_10185 [Sphingomonas sp. MMS24-JH45]